MPVIGTPILSAAAAACSSQSTLAPVVSQVFGCETPAKRRAVSAVQGQAITIEWQFVDQNGRQVDLSTCGEFDPDDPATGEVRLKTRETVISPCASGDPELDIAGEVTDAALGTATFALGAAATERAGIFLAEAAVFDGDGNMQFSNQFHLIVNRGITGGDQNQVSGLPSVAEIRLALRDSDPAGNTLLEDIQFDLAELAAAIEYPILYWNEALPPVKKYTTTTFPFRFHWMRAIVAKLYETAAHYYRRNRLQFTTQGGVGVDDLNKDKVYEEVAARLWAEYKTWVLQKKMVINAQKAVQSSGSWYTGWY